MIHPTARRVCATLALSLLPWLGAVAVGQDLAAFEKEVTEFTLDNGLHFIVLERHETPVVACYTYANVGAADEVKGITGMAHLLEHMAFKGTQTVGTTDYETEAKLMTRMDELFRAIRTEQRKTDEAAPQRLAALRREFEQTGQQVRKLLVPDEFEEVLKQAGGVGLNAATNYDFTVYTASLPSNKFELWMLMESDRFLHPALREFYKEKDVVMEERRQRTESNPVGRLAEEFLAIAFKAHPYGEPAVGHMSDLQALTRPEARTFFDKYYTPSNLTIAVAGDVDPARVKELAQAYFGRLPCRPSPDPARTEEPPQIGERRVVVEDTAQPIIFIGYHKPSMNHPDDAAFNAITDIMGGGRTARLYTSLVKEKKIAISTTCFHGRPGRKYPHLFVFYAVPTQGHTNEECEEAIYAEIKRLQEEPVCPEDLRKAKTRARAGLIRQLDSTAGLASQLAFYAATTGDWRNLFQQLDHLERTTPEDIQRVAKTYFVVRNRTVGMIKTVAPTPGGGLGESR